MRREDFEKLRLICPSCRRVDSSGKLVEGTISLISVSKESKGRIVSGRTACLGCKKEYRIIEGVLCILEPRSSKKIPPITKSYLKASYGNRDNRNYWRGIASLISGNARGNSIDLGCGVGRATFELGKMSEVAVGLDLDFDALAIAEKFAREGKIRYSHEERKLSERTEKSEFSPGKNSLFILASALDPPFSAKSFGRVFAGNLLDSVSNPALLLGQIDALLFQEGSLALTTPFSWKEEVTPRENWLETKKSPGENILKSLLEKKGYSIEREIRNLEWAIPARERMKTVFSVYAIRAKKRKS